MNSRRTAWWITAVLCLGQAMVFVDVAIVNVALPAIASSFTVPEPQLAYTVTAYGAALGGLLILGGTLADTFGARGTLIAGVTGFLAASLVAGFSPTYGVLVAARIAQGMAAALLTPAALSLLNALFPEGPARAKVFGLWGALGGLGAVLGVTLGGILTQAVGWRAIFLINGPISVVVLAGILILVRRDPERRPRGRFDAVGGLLIAGGLVTLCFGLGQLGHAGAVTPAGVTLVVAALALLTAAGYLERRVAHPIIPPGTWARRGLKRIVALTVLAFGTLLTLFFYASLFLAGELGLPPTVAGLAYLPIAVSVVAGSMVGGRLLQSWGAARVMTVAFALSGAGTTIIAIAAPLSRYEVSLLPGFIVAGLGIGSSFVALQVAVMEGVSENAGLIGGIFGTAQEAGGALALALASLVVAAVIGGDTPIPQIGFTVAAVYAWSALLLTLTPSRPRTP